MRKTKCYYLFRLMILLTAELLWIYAMFKLTSNVFGLTQLTFILYTVELCICYPLLASNINLEALHFRKVLKQ